MKAVAEKQQPLQAPVEHGLLWEEVVRRVRAAVEDERLRVVEAEMQLDLENLRRRLELDVCPREWESPEPETFARIKLYYTSENALAADELSPLSLEVPDTLIVEVEYVIADPDSAPTVADATLRVEDRFGKLAPFLRAGARVDLTMRTDFERHELGGAIARTVCLTSSRPSRFDLRFVARIAEALRAMGPWTTAEDWDAELTGR